MLRKFSSLQILAPISETRKSSKISSNNRYSFKISPSKLHIGEIITGGKYVKKNSISINTSDEEEENMQINK